MLKRLSTLKDLQTGETLPETDAFEESLSITGVETFSVNYKVHAHLFLSSTIALTFFLVLDLALEHVFIVLFQCIFFLLWGKRRVLSKSKLKDLSLRY